MAYQRANLHPQALKLRKEAGKYLKQTREAAGLTQRQMADALGIEYYTIISQIEGGKTRLPPEQMEAWAKAVKIDPEFFARRLLAYYDPFMFRMLFSDKSGG